MLVGFRTWFSELNRIAVSGFNPEPIGRPGTPRQFASHFYLWVCVFYFRCDRKFWKYFVRFEQDTDLYLLGSVLYSVGTTNRLQPGFMQTSALHTMRSLPRRCTGNRVLNMNLFTLLKAANPSPVCRKKLLAWTKRSSIWAWTNLCHLNQFTNASSSWRLWDSS